MRLALGGGHSIVLPVVGVSGAPGVSGVLRSGSPVSTPSSPSS